MERNERHKENDHGNGDHGQGGREDKEKTVTIVIDGTPHEVPKKEEITYDEVVALAFPNAQDADYSITYMRGHGDKDGILAPGGSVKVKEGMAFRVNPTGQS